MGGLEKEEDQHLFQMPPILTHMGDSPEPPTTNHIVSMFTQISVVGVRVTDHPKAHVPLTLPKQMECWEE